MTKEINERELVLEILLEIRQLLLMWQERQGLFCSFLEFCS